MPKVAVFLLTFLVLSSAVSSLAIADSFTQKDRELLIRLDERLNQIDKRFEQIDKRFEQIDKRFEQVDKRIEELRQDTNKRFEELRHDMNKRFEQVDKRFQEQNNLMIAIITAFAAIVAVTIAFALWDRRTMIRPFEDRVKKIESDIANDQKKVEALLKALREYAKKDKGLAQILKSFSLL